MPLPLTLSCSSKSRLVLTFLVLPFWYLLTRVVPDIFQKRGITVVCVCVWPIEWHEYQWSWVILKVTFVVRVPLQHHSFVCFVLSTRAQPLIYCSQFFSVKSAFFYAHYVKFLFMLPNFSRKCATKLNKLPFERDVQLQFAVHMSEVEMCNYCTDWCICSRDSINSVEWCYITAAATVTGENVPRESSCTDGYLLIGNMSP